MALDYETALELWGKHKLTEAGFSLDNVNQVNVDLGYQYGWDGCDTCGFGGQASGSFISITTDDPSVHSQILVEDINMLDLFKEILEIGNSE